MIKEIKEKLNKGWSWIKSKTKQILIALGLVGVALAAGNLPIDEKIGYPVLNDGVQYFETTFPVGLRYSEGWYGTFGYAPPAEVLLFDDDLGICIFSMPIGQAPSEPQGGTKLKSLTKINAQKLIESYSLETAFNPPTDLNKKAMKYDDYFSGVWAGDKLKEKWSYNPDATTTAQ